MDSPSEQIALEDLIRRWQAGRGEGELVHLERFAERDPITAPPDPPLPGALEERLRERGIEHLYRHQVAGIRRIREGRHTVLVSGTSSGKTLTYQVPIVERALEDPRTTALLLYPTKALAQDQLGSLQRYRLPGVTAATYDGDTPDEQRRWVRRHATAVLTNPDMLHVGILPIISGGPTFSCGSSSWWWTRCTRCAVSSGVMWRISCAVSDE